MSDMAQYTDEELMELVDTDIAAVLESRGYKHGWYKEAEYVGYIYILVNPSINNMVKIGYATDVEKRMQSLYSSNIPDPYHCYAWYKVRHMLEDKTVHRLIDSLDPDLRHSSKREFYEMSPERAYEILSAVAQISGNDDCLVMNPLNDDFFNNNKKASVKSEKKPNSNSKPMRSALTFEACGIPIGSTLEYVKDKKIKVKTVDDKNRVEYKGQTYSISGLGAKLAGWPSCQGGSVFSYKGVKLVDLRND